MVMSDALDHVADLAAFVIASPSSFHAVAEAARRLDEAGFAEQDEADDWDGTAPGGHYVVRDGALVAWRLPAGTDPRTPNRIVGAHTDSPGFTLKPNPDLGGFGYAQLGMEVYGGPLLNSWLDRELGLAGRVVLTDGRTRLVRTDAIMRIPQLAIHLDRGVNDGLTLDKQQHLVPIWGVGRPHRRLLDLVATLVDARAEQVDGLDLVAYDVAAPTIFGPDGEFLASARLDNLTGVHAGLTALLASGGGPYIELLAAFDHEEVGSDTRSGASGPLLADVLARIAAGRDVGPDQHAQALARSVCLSVDAGHALHPNYPQRHDPANHPVLNGGPLLKINANQRYATDAVGTALWRRACRAAGVPTQEFVSSNALPCGSTIGPLTATRLGIRTVDVGQPLLSMHSARELAGTADAHLLSRAVQAFWAVEA